MVLPAWTLKADLDEDGVYEEDWSSYLQGEQAGVENLHLGRGSALEGFSERSAVIVLDNTDKRFSPKNTAGPYYPDLARGVKVRLSAGLTLPAVTNLDENPSYETNTNGALAASSSIVRVTTIGAKGKCSLKVTTQNVAESGHRKWKVDWTRFAVTAGNHYVYSPVAWGVSGKVMRLEIEWWNATPTKIQTDQKTFTLTGAATRRYIVITAPAGAVGATVRLLTHTPQGIFDFYIDGEMFFQTAIAPGSFTDDDVPPYVDGDQPLCTWSGTAHASTSSRGANPSVDRITGKIRSMKVTRDREWLTRIEVTGLMETWGRKRVSTGPFTRKKARWIAQRLRDVGEHGELIDDGVNRFYGDNVVKASGGTGSADLSDSAKAGGTDPEEYASIEGDQVRAFQHLVADAAVVWKLDLTSRTANGVKYDLAQWISADPGGVGDGQVWHLRLKDDIGTVWSQDVTLDDTTWQYIRPEDLQFNNGSTSRWLEWESTGAVGVMLMDCLHMIPSKNRIDLTFSGSAWDEDIEYLDGADRSLNAAFEELAKSAGGWYYEDGSGGLVMEDYSTRSSSATPKLRLTDSLELDGFGWSPAEYIESATHHNRVRVSSYGDVTLLKTEQRVVWEWEPMPQSLGASVETVLYPAYMSEEESGLIARRAAIVNEVTAGGFASVTRNGVSVSTPYIENYGRGGRIIVKAGGSGVTIGRMVVKARAQNRQTSERTFVRYTVSGTESDEEDELQLDMPGQGYKTTLMSSVAQWAGDKYGAGASMIAGEIRGGTPEKVLEIIGRGPGLPVWVRHNTGPGAYMVDELYYLEDWSVEMTPGELPRLSMLLEEAA